MCKIATEKDKILLAVQGIDRRILEWNLKLSKTIDIRQRNKIIVVINDYKWQKSRLQRQLENGNKKSIHSNYTI